MRYFWTSISGEFLVISFLLFFLFFLFFLFLTLIPTMRYFGITITLQKLYSLPFARPGSKGFIVPDLKGKTNVLDKYYNEEFTLTVINNLLRHIHVKLWLVSTTVRNRQDIGVYILGLHRILLWPDIRPGIRLKSNLEFFYRKRRKKYLYLVFNKSAYRSLLYFDIILFVKTIFFKQFF